MNFNLVMCIGQEPEDVGMRTWCLTSIAPSPGLILSNNSFNMLSVPSLSVRRW
jgi:hypothetical protein